MKFIRKTIAPYVLLSGCAMAVAPRESRAQSASLYQQDIPLTQGRPTSLANTSWLYQKVDPPKEIKLHDIVTVVVSEKNQLISEGQVQRRPQGPIRCPIAKLDCVQGVKPSGLESRGRRAACDRKFKRAKSGAMELETRDALLFRISATVVDIRPNGTFVIEARKTVPTTTNFGNAL